MIMSVSSTINELRFDNGLTMRPEALSVRASTVCTGVYTDYTLRIPLNADVSRGAKKLRNNGEPFTFRVYHTPGGKLRK